LNLNNELKDTLSEAPLDEWLFGENLNEVLKNSRSLQATESCKACPKEVVQT